MKRPKTIFSNKRIWFGLPGIFLLVIAFALSVASSSMAATGSFDRQSYVPSFSDTNDFDRAWISVTDSTANTSSGLDTITVTIKTGTNATSFTLKETGTNTGVFTSNAGTQSVSYPVGTASGYVEDFNRGSHNFPALGTGTTGLELKNLSANTGGNAGSGQSGELTVSSGDTLELLYAGSTLATAPVNTYSGAIVFSPSAVSAINTDSLSNVNVILSITDQDENLNPVIKDVIGFADGSALLSGNPGAGSSRIQIAAIDQTTGSTLSLGGTPVLAKNIMFVENSNNSGVFIASGKVFGSTTASVYGNVSVDSIGGTSTTSGAYAGSDITFTDGSNSVTFKIIETNASGKIGLYYLRDDDVALGFVSPSSGVFPALADLSLSKVVASYDGSNIVSLFVSTLPFSNSSPSPSGIIKLIDGSNYCLVAISSFTNSVDGTASDVIDSATISLGSFQLAGPRSGDTLRVSYLDELNNGGISGTVTGTAAYGVSGVTGTVAQNNDAPDINDYVTITVVDPNLNTVSSTKESVSAGSSLWNGTTTNSRGDILKVKSYTQGSKTIGVSHPDGFGVGTQSVRISNTDNSLVWVVPTSAGTFSNPLSSGVTSFALGTESVSAIPLVKGVSSEADSFLSSASSSSFVATLDGVDNSVEISPDGTRWVSVPIYETGANSSTFVGTVGFDYTAVRLTTSTSKSITTLISDFTGTSTILFDGTLDVNTTDVIGTGSVVRIFDGSTQEYAEVCSVGASSVSVSKLANSTAFVPSKTYVQVIGNDMSKLDTISGGTVLSRIGGICSGTYRVRYNDALGSGNVYLGGNTLAVTASNFGFVTYDASLSTNVTGSIGPDTYVVVTLADQDLNTSNSGKQTTAEDDNASGKKISNEDGIGTPSSASGSNTTFINGGTSKIVYASKLSSLTSNSLDLGVNTIDFHLTETANDSGTFKGSFQLSSSTTTSNSSDLLKVSNGDSVFVTYIDGPNGSCDTFNVVTDPISIITNLGVISLSKDSAYLSGDTIVASVVDADRNTTTAQDSLTSAIKVSGVNYNIGDDVFLNLSETGGNTGSFVATFTTNGDTASGTAVKTIQGGILNVVYTDNSPQNATATKQLSLSSCDAEMAFDADAFGLNSFATVTLSDCERNTNSSNVQTLLNDVFITSSSGANTKMRMVETGNDTGVFAGSIKLVSTGGTVEFSQIQVAVGDTVLISYFDTTTIDGTTKQVSDTATVSDVIVGNITGRITDAATSVAINGATVIVEGTGKQGTTNQNGIYLIQDVPTGTRTVNVAANGFTSVSQDVTVVEGNPNPQTNANIFDFALTSTGGTPTPTPTGSPTPTPTPGGVGNIAGRVTDADTGAGINGATVTITSTGQKGTTDNVQGQDGFYAIPNVPVGTQTLTAEADGFTSSSKDVTVLAGNPNPGTGANFFNFDLSGGTPTPTPTGSPTPTPTPSCVPVKMTASPKPLKIVKGQSAEETITVVCNVEDDLRAASRLVQATITSGKKRITVSPPSVLTDDNGEAKFTITATEKTGQAKVKFQDATRKDVKVNVTVKVKNK